MAIVMMAMEIVVVMLVLGRPAAVSVRAGGAPRDALGGRGDERLARRGSLVGRQAIERATIDEVSQRAQRDGGSADGGC